MAYVGSSYLVGLFFASFLNSGLNLTLAPVTAVTSAVMPSVLGKKYICAAVCLISGALAMFLYGLYDSTAYQNVVKYNGYDVEMEGIIIEYTERKGDKSSYIVDGVINDDVRAKVICYTDNFGGDIGDRVNLIGAASVFEDSYTFSSLSYYKAKGIYLRINNIKYIECTPREGFSLLRTANRYRSCIIKTVSEHMSEDGQGVMSAMLFGDKSDLESSQKTLMYRAGIGHLMAVSGVHLAVVCSFFNLFIARLPVNKYFRFGILLVPIGCFVLLAGMSASVIRAAVMLIIVYGADLFRRQADVWNSLGIAVILLTIRDPFAVRDPSFLLSAAGVFSIGVAAPAAIRLIEEKRKLGASARSAVTSVCVTALVFPVSMLFFDEVSVMSPVTNLLLMPICTAILIGGLIVTVTGGAAAVAVPVLKICGFLCDIVLGASKFIGGLRFSYIPLDGKISVTAVIAAAVLTGVIFLRTRKADVTALSAAAILILAMISIDLYRLIPDDRITIAVIRDGDSSEAIIHDKRTASVIDITGSGKASSSAVKYLNRKGIYKIDSLILTDGGDTSYPVYMEAFELFEVRSVLISEKSGNRIDAGEYSFSFIDEDTFTVSCLGQDIMFYSSEDPTSEDGDIYIGESVKVVVGPDGSVRSEAIH